jgi:hypothetical protein
VHCAREEAWARLAQARRSIYAGIFIGYEEGAKAYRVYDPVGERIYVTRDVAFEERRAWS